VIGGLIVAVAALTFVLVPALAATGGPVKPPSGAGVTPQKIEVGPAGFTCSDAAIGSPGTMQFTIPRPGNGTFQIAGTPYAIVLSHLSSDPAKVDWAATGGLQVFDLGVVSDEKVAWYRYRPPVTPYGSPNQAYANGTLASGRLSDTAVHGGDNDSDDHLGAMTFCYGPLSKISGKVWADANLDGSSSGESGIPNWPVRLYSNGQVIGTSTTRPDGSYTLYANPVGSYTVCAVPSPPSPPWFQTSPTSGTTGASQTCSANDELGFKAPTPGYGYSVVNPPIAGVANLDFGAAQGASFTCGTNPTSPTTPGDSFSFDCGSKLGGAYSFFTNAYTENGKQKVLIQAVAPATGSPSGAVVPFLEKITWTYTGNDQNALLMSFDDSFPYNQLIPMKRCNYDPRPDPTSVAPLSAPQAGILPDYTQTLPQAASASDYRSCILYQTERAPTPSAQGGSPGTYVFYVYSEADSFRSD
jgi:hypothetical protein